MVICGANVISATENAAAALAEGQASFLFIVQAPIAHKRTPYGANCTTQH